MTPPRILTDPDGTPMREVWRIRGTPQEIRPAGWFYANSRNWRIHPRNQREALVGTLGSIGWIDSVKVNLRTSELWGTDQGIPTMLDGHCRIEESLKEGDDVAVPLEYYDLTPAEEAEALATLDPLSAMAVTDAVAFDALLREVSTDSPAVQAMLDAVATEAGLVAGVEPQDLWKGMPEFEQEDKAWKMLHVYFLNEDDYKDFQRLVGQSLTEKTTFIWHPEQKPEDLTVYRCDDES